MAKTMPAYELEITPHGSGVRAEVSGDLNLATTLAYWREIAAQARACGADSLLLVDTLTGPPLQESDWLHVVTSLQGEGLQKLRIAHVKPLGLRQEEFCEIFARDAGIEARVFENETLANVWLRFGER
jgi:hypothetical protein